jgi:hypothetical protein
MAAEIDALIYIGVLVVAMAVFYAVLWRWYR